MSKQQVSVKKVEIEEGSIEKVTATNTSAWRRGEVQSIEFLAPIGTYRLGQRLAITLEEIP